MIGIVSFYHENAKIKDSIRLEKVFRNENGEIEEVQLFGSYSTYFIDECNCVMLLGGGEVYLKRFEYITNNYRYKNCYVEGVKNDFVESN